jgi:type I restriction enzyme S subunit
MLVRLVNGNPDKAAYLFGFLNSQLAYKQISCLTYGGSIPHFDVAGIKTVLVPRLGSTREKDISKTILAAMRQRDEALTLELEARHDIETAIAGAN